jgi:hypothetical protein
MAPVAARGPVSDRVLPIRIGSDAVAVAGAPPQAVRINVKTIITVKRFILSSPFDQSINKLSRMQTRSTSQRAPVDFMTDN